MADEMREPGSELIEDMEISRGEKPETKLNFSEIEELEVQDEDGYKIKFGDLYKDKKTIVIFIRVSFQRFVYTCLV